MIFTAAQLSALPVLDTCDVLIAGGGVAGVAAALSAARAGAKVTLIEREYALGGLATLGLITYYLPLCDGMGRQVSFGLAEELLRLSISQGAEGEYPQEWFENGACDGFNVMPPVLPQSLNEFVDLVVPELQKRGLFRTAYEGRTLRENLGLERPASRYAVPLAKAA